MTRRHLLMCTLPGYGHVIPQLDLFAELVRTGHRVTVAVGADFAERVAATGATPCSYAPLEGPDPGAHRLAAALSGGMRCLAPLAPVRRLLAEDPPDLLAFDSTMWVAGRVLAWGADRPTVQTFPCFASNDRYSLLDHVLRYASADDADGATDEPDDFDGLPTAVGAPGLAALLDDARDHRLVLLPRAFQYAGDTFDDRFTFTGPCFGPSRPLHGWTPPSDDPVLLVSLGTSAFNQRPDFFRGCADAFAGLPWNLVLTLGGGIDVASLGSLPPNVQAHQWLAHTTVLPHAAAFVTSAGMSSILEALYCATPLVLVPQHGEQEANTDRVLELGLGRRLPGARMTPEQLRATVLEVAGEPSYRQRAEWIRAECLRGGGAEAAAACLARLSDVAPATA